MPNAAGPFHVTISPQPADDFADGAVLGRMTLDKRYEGELEATSRGQMLTGMGTVKGSAGYVAIERVTGSLAGRRGSFLLQHSGSMIRGAQQLSVTVIADSGTEELAGLTGSMMIRIDQGKHMYEFEYTLAPIE